MKITFSGLLSEKARNYTATVFCAILTFVLRKLLPTMGHMELLIVLFAFYLFLYVGLTTLAFHLTPGKRILSWSEKTREISWLRAFFTSEAPGGGMAVSVSAVSLLTAAYVLPRVHKMAILLAPWQLAMAAVAIIVGSWFAIALTYAIAYLCHDARAQFSALAFPGNAPRQFSDYLYFSFAISTTFATNDVTILDPALRRKTTPHSIIAFIFNTAILAMVVSLVN